MNMTRGIAVSLITALLLIHGVPCYGWSGFSRTINVGGGGTSYNGDLSSITTDNITEGTFNKYYMDARARAALSASLPLSYNTSTGVFSLTTVPITSGGTGLATTPVKGQMFIGNDNGTFRLNTLNAGSNVTITNDNGSVTIAASTGSSPLWGNITGTLSAQGDLQTTLNTKEPTVAAGTNTRWYNGTKNWFTFYSDNATEGTTNLYYTNARARAALTGLGLIDYNSGTGAISLTGTTTNKWLDGTGNYFFLYSDNVTEGGKLYWSQSRFNTAFSGMTTDNLSQGTGNLYFTNSAARAALSGAGSITYDNTTGIISYVSPQAPTYDNLTVSNVLSINNIVKIGTMDAFSRYQIWNYMPNSVLRLGASQGDGDATNVSSQGIIVYGPNLQGDTMTSSDLSYARVKNDRFGLYSLKATNSELPGYYFRVDPNGLYLTENNGVKTYQIDRLTGNTTISGGLKIGSLTGVLTASGGSVAAGNTDNITEGVMNKFYSDSLARAAVSAVAPLSYNSTTGAISIAGVTSTPVKGQLLIGNDNGTFGLNTLTAGSNITITNDNNSITIAASGGGGGGTWGGITGTLSAQSDLQTALNSKEATVATGTSGDWYNGTKNWFTLYTDNITQGTNLWFTNSAARTALSAGTGISYDNTTGVITATGGGGGSIGGIDNFTLTTNQSGQAQVANWVIDNIILAFFKLAIHAALSVFNMVDGVFDKFENQAGIDNRTVAWSDNVTYLVSDHTYVSVPASGGVAGTNLCSAPDYPGYPRIYGPSQGGDWIVTNLCDNSTVLGGVWSAAGLPTIEFEFSAPIVLQGYNILFNHNYAPTAWGFYGSNDNSSWTLLDSQSGITLTYGKTNTYMFSGGLATYQFWKFDVTAGQGGYAQLGEMHLLAGDVLATYRNMLLTSVPYTAPFNPTKARLIFVQQDNTTQGITLNTDLKAYVSSDNGTSWTQVTLAKDDVIQAGTSSTPAWNLLSGDATLEGSNNQMRWRLMTFNNDNVTNKGTAVRAAALLVQ
ncbi:beta strand repeat-containing protein [Candidatus Magnetominusculus xianensis]|uniref:Uncharacterized protein n=1 Tax=Candidatus Magnetominusculus xianensis TaxID=1748249 RepID=A0ABR5SHX2_9BACT|nr:hypothetical protein [Candidatus Magnetominusculus xianensis]KWT91834.1 hypothetical protein ASN18_0736 [Candidatus Magnetominusculus xianensis]MBF0403889.1 hypothetical protein [Nitrospirota bacterium]